MVALTALIVQIALLSAPVALCQNPEEEGDYFEGDIEDFVPPTSDLSGEISKRRRWNSNTVPYAFASSYPKDLQDLFISATKHIASRTQSCIKFVKRTTEVDYVHVKSGNDCSSKIGKAGGRQEISLPRKCNILGTFVHEIIHAIGFYHEQSRLDRDDYVKIYKANIKQGMENNFKKYNSNTFGLAYDYGSIMHYSRTAFSKDKKNKLPTIEPIKRNVEIGQRVRMSDLDVAKVKQMYNCK